ncbi:hypothetical protein FJTKL_00435 [Diaporthe vaccinii]|uniref:Uncharacterized protein n=1 Tax=Diaporthe vaccinii TaxID=105482 RepID=A0ABR4E2Y6_9PEZI
MLVWATPQARHSQRRQLGISSRKNPQASPSPQSCRPSVFGSAVQSLANLDALNTSNQFIRSFTLGAAKNEIPPTTNPIFADVRDVADAHVQAFEQAAAANKRFFITNGYCSNRQIIEIIRQNFPESRESLPDTSVAGEGKHNCPLRASLV